MSTKNRYPVYIISKGRYKNMLTPKALDRLGIEYKLVVEEFEYDEYCKVVDPNCILILPKQYLIDYDTCDNAGETRKGSGAARNYCIDHSKNAGFKRHWLLDDNIDDFHRLHNNIKCPVRCPATFIAAEDFVDRYSNVPLAGFNYYSFCKATDRVKPFTLNTRVFSCILLDNDSGYRWRARFNEDLDLSLRILKDGHCTILFNAFLCGKVTTQRMKGGNSQELYGQGTLAKSKMIEDLHPDVAKVVWRFNRWHHHVDYSKFKENKLVKIDNTIYDKINDYDMVIVDGVTEK